MKSIIILPILPGFPRPASWEGPDIVMEVQKTSEEYKRVATEFERSVGCRVDIVKIVRIQNHQLWQAYRAHRQETVEDTPAETPAERWLYHGCPFMNVDSINENGFVTNLAGTHAGECSPACSLWTNAILYICMYTHTHVGHGCVNNNILHRVNCAVSSHSFPFLWLRM